MKISQLRVRIGGHEQILTDRVDNDPDIAKLMELATSSSAVITIEVPQNDETAAALGRLIFGQPKSKPDVPVAVPTVLELLPALSKRLDELDFSPRSANCLRYAGYTFVWEVAEKTEADMLKTKNLGRRSLNEIKEVFADKLSVRLGMDLSSVKQHLPPSLPRQPV